MNPFFFYLLLLLSPFSLLANDGTYLTHGGVIYPTQETRISLEKEILSFTVRDRMGYVDIQFTFHNPDAESRKLLIGFQAPTGTGDVSQAQLEQRIEQFSIMQNGKILPYQLHMAECEDCPLQEPGSLELAGDMPGIYVYLFEVVFVPGRNQLQHSYRFPASSNVAFDQFYSYILTTGAKWAGGQIGDLSVHIDMGPDAYFFVNDMFGPEADWSVIGTGVVTEEKFVYETDCRMIRTLSGKLQIQVRDFSPQQNLQFGVINDRGFINRIVHHELLMNEQIVPQGPFQIRSSYSPEQLRLLRNTIYARYGYAFKSPDLQAYFGQFGWYLPDPNLKLAYIPLTEAEKAFIEEIRTLEQKK